MSGIEILSKFAITVPQTWIFIVFGILLVVFGVSLLWWAHKETKIKAIISCSSLMLSIIVLCLGNNTFTKETGYYDYYAYIDETVNLVEFDEKYEIITHYDDIYVLRNKVPEKMETT